MEPDRLFTPEDVAKVLLLKPETVREWLRTGKLKGVKMGRLWRIRERDFGPLIFEMFHKVREKE